MERQVGIHEDFPLCCRVTLFLLVSRLKEVGQMEALEVQGPDAVWERPQMAENMRVRTRLGAKGRLVIPAEIRAALGMADGGMLDMVVVDGELRIATMRERLRRAQERVRQVISPGVSLADELSAERREAAKHE
jgi:AbrB family looped-hinge helix DNA binding protein